MKKKIIGILVCTLLIATVLPAVGFTNKADSNQVIYEFTVENECGCTSWEGYGLGHIPLTDWVEETSLPEPTGTFLASLDWRSHTYNSVTGNWMTSVKNQQTCGSCWAFTALGTLEAIINIANTNPNLDYDLSEQYMVSCVPAQGICPNDCTGGHAMYCYKYMQTDVPPGPNWGALPESCFPYINANGNCNNKCGNWISQLITSITGYLYSVSLSVNQIKAQLANGPVCGAMDVWDNFWQPGLYSGVWDGNGVYTAPAGPYIGLHAIVICGYVDDGSYPTGGYWICKNSWGTGWGPSGMGGYFGMPYSTCNIESEMTWVTFTPSGDTPPTAAYTWVDADAGGPGTVINFDATGSSDDNGITKYEWDWTNDGTYDYTGGPTASYDYGDCNSYSCKLRVTDTISQTNTVTHSVQATGCGGNNPPTTPSKPSGPTSGVPGVPYRYTTSATDPDPGDQIKYGWDFNNDGIIDPGHWTGFHASGATCNIDITFASQGTYYLSVIAEDNHGAQSAFSPALTVVITTGTNNPPTVHITSPSDGATVSGTISIQGTAADSDGTVTQVQVKIDSGSWWTASGTASWSTNFDTNIVSDGSHTIYAQSKDDKGAYSALDSVPITINNGGTNNPPNKPSKPNGPGSGKTGTLYPYTTSTTDIDGDKIKYGWDWTGNGMADQWDDNGGSYYASGTPISTSHSWPSQGTYNIKVIAEDINGAQSVWSDPLSVSIPKSKYAFNPGFIRLLQQFIDHFPILAKLLKLV